MGMFRDLPDGRRPRSVHHRRRGLTGSTPRFVKQQLLRTSTKPRGQLSGAVSKTKEGKQINKLKVEAVLVTANSTTGHRGPWFIIEKKG